MSGLDVLVVIPCLNEINHIELLLHKLLLENPALIVVADGGSTDGTIELVKSLASTDQRIQYLYNPARIQSSAVNLAIKEFGKGFEYFIRIDAHGEYPVNFLSDLLEEASLQNADSVVVSMSTVGKSCFQEAAAAAQNSKLGNGGSSHRNESFIGRWIDHGHHALMRVDAFKSVGGYDESFVANEDAELDHRFGLAGNKIWLTAKTGMTYFPRKTLKSLYLQYYRYGVGRASNVIKHGSIPKIRQLVPLSVFPASILALFMIVHWVAVVPFLSWLILCLLYGIFLGYKANKPCVFFSGIAAATMHMGWSLGFCSRLFRRLFWRY